MALLELTPVGLYCAAGDFYIDPWAPVSRAVITHAHADRARPGSAAYVTTRHGAGLLALQLPDASIQTVDYGEPLGMNDVRVSLHPSGHILGSAQVRIEHRGEVWVVAGDFNPTPDLTCAPFEPLRCHTFVTEATFALPIFRWTSEAELVAEIHSWWRANQEAGRASLLFANPLGKAQRVLARLDASIGPICADPAIERFNTIYRENGVPLPSTGPLVPGALVLAPPGTDRRAYGTVSTALASGWMRIRGTRRRQSLDRGFVISDHADWPGLLSAIDATNAEAVWVTHGFRTPLVHWLEEHGRRAVAIETRFGEPV
jgi:putative mRNA 3-end processing factor